MYLTGLGTGLIKSGGHVSKEQEIDRKMHNGGDQGSDRCRVGALGARWAQSEMTYEVRGRRLVVQCSRRRREGSGTLGCKPVPKAERVRSTVWGTHVAVWLDSSQGCVVEWQDGRKAGH